MVLLQFLVYRHAEDRFQPNNNHLNQHVPKSFVKYNHQELIPCITWSVSGSSIARQKQFIIVNGLLEPVTFISISLRPIRSAIRKVTLFPLIPKPFGCLLKLMVVLKI